MSAPTMSGERLLEVLTSGHEVLMEGYCPMWTARDVDEMRFAVIALTGELDEVGRSAARDEIDAKRYRSLRDAEAGALETPFIAYRNGHGLSQFVGEYADASIDAALRSGMRDAYEGAREDLLDWKRRAEQAEAELRRLGYTGIVPRQPPAVSNDAIRSALQAALEWARPMEEAPVSSRPDWFDQGRKALRQSVCEQCQYELTTNSGVVPVPCSKQGYVDAFYEVCKLLDIPAMTISPKEAWETVIRPKLASLAGASP